MTDLIPRPDEPAAPTAICKTDMGPISPADTRTSWQKFVDFIRQNVGLKPLDLAKRFGEAEARKREALAESQEVDNDVKLLKAKQEYELVQAEIRRRQLEAEGQAVKAKAEADEIRARTRSRKALARIQETAARAIEARSKTPEEAMDEVNRLIERIRDAGGDVEIDTKD